ncbi:KAP family P-loop NTPase fold protein [Tenacibaculum piscium]|uniref:KAP family P-loop NTPase fold protein n=1 Tax=Tenacibaculum piscium TaxID=1458515 RepID=UPI001F422C8C|nr:P-loop NTPase fold protein [Tenacibaculum piscium]
MSFHIINDTPFKWLNKFEFYYSDIIFLLLIFTVILFIRNNFIKTDKSPSNYLKEDLPLNGEISINNEKVVDKLITTIDGFYPEVAFIIGINAKWGKGKTTFINRFKNKITEKNKKIITFDFNAWKHHDEKSIITNFFSQLNKELSKYNGNATPTINQYVNSLLSINNNSYIKSVKLISDTLSSKQSTTGFYTEIGEIIKNTTRQIIVFVDDLDRLNKQEIDETLRILRNVANFNNMIFICGVDRDYLEQKGELDSGFLNKIFNLEINLPVQNEKSFLSELIIYIKDIKENILSPEIINEIVKTLDYKEADDYSSNNNIYYQSIFFSESDSSFPSLFSDSKNSEFCTRRKTITPSFFFDSQRDVKKFYNKLVFNIQVLEKLENINTYDYILFHLLVSKYPWMYEQFNDKNLAKLLTITDENNLNFRDKNDSKLKLEINNNKKLNDSDLTIIHSVLYELFNCRSSQNDNRINQKRNLPIYLKNNIFNESLTYSEIIDAIDKLEVNELIKEISEDNITAIKDEIIKKENLQKIEHFEQVFELLNTNNNIEINKEELIDILAWAGENDNINNDEFEELLDSIVFTDINNEMGNLLKLSNSKYTNLSSKSSNLEEDNNKELTFINPEYVKIKLIKLFKEFLEKENDLSKVTQILQQYWCKEYHLFGLNTDIYYTEITELFIKYLDKNFNYFLKFKLDRNISYDFFGEIFTDKEAQKEVLEHAIDINNSTGNLSSKFDPHKTKYLNNGRTHFLEYLSNKKETGNFTDIEKIKIDDIMKIIKNNIA